MWHARRCVELADAAAAAGVADDWDLAAALEALARARAVAGDRAGARGGAAIAPGRRSTPLPIPRTASSSSRT